MDEEENEWWKFSIHYATFDVEYVEEVEFLMRTFGIENDKQQKNNDLQISNIDIMTTEQYTRAIQISERLKDLKQVKKAIISTTHNRLTYEIKGDRGYDTHPSWVIQPIGNILDRHDKVIREEIDQEIEALTKEIETI